MIFDKLLATLLLTLSTGSNIDVDIREPNRQIYQDTYKVVNATTYEVNVYSHYWDEDWTVEPNSTAYITHNSSAQLNLVLTDYPSSGNPDNKIGYCYFAPDSDEIVYPDWNLQQSGTWICTIEGYEPSDGIGIYTKYPLPTNKDYFFNTNLFETTNSTNLDTDIQVLPTGAVANIYKEDGSFTQVNSEKLRLLRYKVEGTTMMATALAIDVTPQNASYKNYMIVAMNFLYGVVGGFLITNTTNQLVEMAQKSINTMSASMFFYSSYTNRIRYVSGYYPFGPNEKGYNEPYYITDINFGYLGFNQNGDSADSDTFTALKAGTDLMEKAIAVAVTLFGFVIFPGITVGTLILIPLLASLLLWIIRLLKRGG